jgi:cyclase
MPCLLLKAGRLVKTIKFKNPGYVGDPINAVRIYNDKEVDDLIVLDIGATVDGTPVQTDLLSRIAGECFMPLAYGGGIASVEQAQAVLKLGAEKVAVNTGAVEQPDLVTRLADRFGSQAVIGSIDVRKRLFGRYEVYVRGGRKATGIDPVAHAVALQSRGAGELLVTSIDRDGTMSGYDIELLRRVTAVVSLPVIACGGAGSVEDFGRAVRDGGASAVAAGSMVVYQGPHRAVLINFPTRRQVAAVLGDDRG